MNALERFNLGREYILTQPVEYVMESTNYYGDCNDAKTRIRVERNGSSKWKFPEAYIINRYGNWWNECPSSTDEFMHQNNSGSIISDDYLEICFAKAVYPMSLSWNGINTSGVVRVWALQPRTIWVLIWEGQNARNDSGLVQTIKLSLKCTKHAASVYRIDFNQRNQDYHTEISDVVLVGCKTVPILFSKRAANNLDSAIQSTPTVTDQSLPLTEAGEDLKMAECSILQLPDEINLKICGYLDIQSLTRLRATCHYLKNIAESKCLYRKLSFKSSWYCLTGAGLKTFIPRCEALTKLDMSWCGLAILLPSDFSIFLTQCGRHLTHLRLNHSEFATEKILVEISKLCPNMKELELRDCRHLWNQGFASLKQLTKLERLDLYGTRIRSPELLQILEANPKLKHLNLGNTSCITGENEILEKLAQANKQLVSLNLWACAGIRHMQLQPISELQNLQELDLSWCKELRATNGESLRKIARGCPKLRKLFLTSWTAMTDENLLPFVEHCPDLEQISLFGLQEITSDVVLEFLMTCKHIKLIDVNGCSQISTNQVTQWREMYPEIVFKDSLKGRSVISTIN